MLSIGKIDNVVGQPAERVDGVDVLALRLGQQGRAPEVGGAVAARSAWRTAGSPRSARLRCEIQSFIAPAPEGSAATRLAASLPEMSTIGTPTPGTVPEPAKNMPGNRRSTFDGPERPGLGEGVGQRERCAGRHALSLPLQRGDQILGDHVAGISLLRQGMRAGDRASARPRSTS